MAKKKKDKEEPKAQKPFEITSAQITDDFCNYEFDILTGVGVGDTHKVKGKGIIDPDMQLAFNKFNVHLAAIDGVFKHLNIEVTDIDALHGHERTFDYNVTGFSIKGGEGNESIILKGNKFLDSLSGRMELTTPKISLDAASSYKWYNELKAASDQARYEVELYKGGKCTAVDPKEDLNADQNKIDFNAETEEA